MLDSGQLLLAIGSLAGAVTTIIALIKLIMTPISRQLKENSKDNKAIKTGLHVILRRDLQYECQKAIENQTVSNDEVKEITDIYEAYHNLGGNGSGTAIYNRVMRLGDNRSDAR